MRHSQLHKRGIEKHDLFTVTLLIFIYITYWAPFQKCISPYVLDIDFLVWFMTCSLSVLR